MVRSARLGIEWAARAGDAAIHRAGQYLTKWDGAPAEDAIDRRGDRDVPSWRRPKARV